MSLSSDKITLRQLQIFLVAIETRSFVRAAERLELTPPAVSMQMSRLSEALGAPLFEKSGRSVIPSQIATALVPYAERMTETLAEAVDVVQIMQGKLDHRVRVAMVSTARNFGPHLLAQFQQEHPDCDLQFKIANRRAVIEMLETDQIDLALMGRPPRRLETISHQFAKHPYVLIGHPDHPLVRSKRIRRSDLPNHRFLVREAGSGTRMVHEHFFSESDLPQPKAQEMDSNANIKQAVMANMGLAFISAHTIALELMAGKLKILSVEGMPEFRDWFVLHKREKRLRPAARTFRDFVDQKGLELMQDFFKDAGIAT
ncbi:LysR family transcriptional regulator [Ruegeria sp.]|uniref:LysR family transcriptional regulator n=1 Tax=Ruegeria sp. TaxID=1879320 RepID=UPI003C7CB896